MIDDVPTSAAPPRSARRVGAVSRRVAVLAVVVCASVLAACSDDGGASDAAGDVDPSTSTADDEVAATSSGTDADDPDVPGGESCPASVGDLAAFGSVQLTLALASGGAGREADEVCLLLADDAGLRQQGLMGVADLGAFDGMLFAYAGTSTGAYWMRDTPMPLSIAWISPEGEVVGTADMEPCLDAGATCPTYGPEGAAYRWAIEVPQGDLGSRGLEPGVRLDVSGWPVGAA